MRGWLAIEESEREFRESEDRMVRKRREDREMEVRDQVERYIEVVRGSERSGEVGERGE